MTCIGFDLHVTEPETGTVHSYLDGAIISDGVPISEGLTFCGAYCTNWPVLVGGEVTCDACLLIGKLSIQEDHDVRKV